MSLSTEQPRRVLARLLSSALALCAVAAIQIWFEPLKAGAENASTLIGEGNISLGDVRGRIDHMAIDRQRGLLFIAELENNSLGIVDIKARTVRQRITGLSVPQGIAYLEQAGIVMVANGGDGSLRLFRSEDHSEAGRVDVGEDADNIRLDPTTGFAVVGYGNGALAIIDPAARRKIADFVLQGHPEGFQLDPAAKRAFVNVPKLKQVVVLDLVTGAQLGAWSLEQSGNFPMAIDSQADRLFVGFRDPPSVAVFSKRDGVLLRMLDLCADVDDLHLDSKRQRVYASCGEGFVDVIDIAGENLRRVDRVRTAPGARTSLFVPELDRLFVAARASSQGPASLLILRPAP